ncbi:hypothetical protein EMEDMD4_90015 [Sinorhizobium medicae]|uniref:Uncharacterized protein n=1 Tax=Sinorhizobium medicae TaxID=110321 RepID=A0A508X6X5_9HYPH|nr:hypothetical protein EMEDMD4_90015 [Sinorhizobium medicae]
MEHVDRVATLSSVRHNPLEFDVITASFFPTSVSSHIRVGNRLRRACGLHFFDEHRPLPPADNAGLPQPCAGKPLGPAGRHL